MDVSDFTLRDLQKEISFCQATAIINGNSHISDKLVLMLNAIGKKCPFKRVTPFGAIINFLTKV